MADTKIGDLPTDVTTLADGDKFPVADASALTVNTYATALEIKTHANNAPVFAAGSASANSWPKFTSGTLLTTAEDGAIELDGDCFYGCTDAGNRGYIPVRHFVRCDSTASLASSGSEQQIFDSPTNGRITLETGTYMFEGMIYVTGLSATSGNFAIDPLGAGTATCGTWLWHACGIDNSTPTNTATQTGTFSITQQSAASIVTAGTGTAAAVELMGTFEVTSEGTMIPGITLVTAAAGTVEAGSYMIFERIGSSSAVSVGQWD